jgi:DNA-binding transcriptional regulator YiaG
VTYTPDTIKALRQAHGMTQEGFAQALGVTFSTVNRWETGKSKPSKHTAPLLDALAKKAARA